MDDWSPLARTIYQQKYAHPGEDWNATAKRVAWSVLGSTPLAMAEKVKVLTAIRDRHVLPGGRYLAAAGRKFHQVQNCLCLRALDTAQGWAELMGNATAALMSGAGIGVDYSALRPRGAALATKGGVSSGPLALMHMVNEAGRYIRQGGERRSAIWAGLNWNHPDALDFIEAKRWTPEQQRLKAADDNFPLPLEGTNISVILDRKFFREYAAGDPWARGVYRAAVQGMLQNGEPGFSIDYANRKESLRNAPVAADTWVLCKEGAGSAWTQVFDLIDVPTQIWTGQRWSPPVSFTRTAQSVRTLEVRYWTGTAHTSIVCDPNHPFMVQGIRVAARHLTRGVELTIGLRPTEPVFVDTFHYQKATVTEVLESGRIEDVFCVDVQCDEHTFAANGVVISNCTEFVSEDDSDVCNLGSVNLGRIKDYDEFVKAVEACTTLLLAGTLYSDVPYPKVAQVRDRNRRLGVGLMGIHDWCLQRGLPYGESPELTRWLEAYATVSTETAARLAKDWGVPVPLATRAIAPTGSIAIIGETTSGIEPIYAVAYKRRYRGPDGKLQYQYVVDPTAKRLIDGGVKPDAIEDAFTLAQTPERRIAFQAYVQGYVDQAISSTLNLPAYGSEANPKGGEEAFGALLMQYLPKLRGITCFPDGARGAQPLTAVKYETAVDHVGQVFVEQADICELTSGGSCGA
jgi:ribonucleotide reductase alpha subunit